MKLYLLFAIVFLLTSMQCLAKEPNQLFGAKLGDNINNYNFDPGIGVSNMKIFVPTKPLPEFTWYAFFHDRNNIVDSIKGDGRIGEPYDDLVALHGKDKANEIYSVNKKKCIDTVNKFKGIMAKKYDLKFIERKEYGDRREFYIFSAYKENSSVSVYLKCYTNVIYKDGSGNIDVHISILLSNDNKLYMKNKHKDMKLEERYIDSL